MPPPPPVLPPMQPFIPIYDPSGYIFEAVPSNRLSGVTVTIYERDGGLWNAEDFDQENPLVTDWGGRYAWDVPFGWWQVRGVLPGYEPVESEWLPVPPPQLEVNLGMISRAAPIVDYVSGFESFIEIAFDRYMDPATLTTGNITLDGYLGEYEIVMVDAEENLDDPAKTFARTIRIVPQGGTFPLGETLGLFISSVVKSYAGTALGSDYQSDVKIVTEPRNLTSPGQISLQYAENRAITVSVLPAVAGANRKITAVSGSSLIATVEAEAVTDASGTATFHVKGELSGATELTFALSGTQLTGTSQVMVALPGENANDPKTWYQIKASAGAGGTVTGGGSYEKDGTVTLKAMPNTNYSFEGWYEDGVKVQNAAAVYTFAATVNRTLEARFIQNTSPNPPDEDGGDNNGTTPPGGDGTTPPGGGGSNPPKVVDIGGSGSTREVAGIQLTGDSLLVSYEDGTTERFDLNLWQVNIIYSEKRFRVTLLKDEDGKAEKVLIETDGAIFIGAAELTVNFVPLSESRTVHTQAVVNEYEYEVTVTEGSGKEQIEIKPDGLPEGAYRLVFRSTDARVNPYYSGTFTEYFEWKSDSISDDGDDSDNQSESGGGGGGCNTTAGIAGLIVFASALSMACWKRR